MSEQPNSWIFYRGPSQLDGSPIIGVITGLATPSTNTKTGDMLQTYILLEKLPPPEGVKTGADAGICGDCALRGDGNGLGRACYVQTKWAPLSVWKYVQPQLADWVKPIPIHFTRAALPGRFLRMGTYGDPTAIPLYVWEWLLAGGIAGHTGYTHQWRDPRFRDFRGLCMASVDSIEEWHDAKIAGWRTFRTRPSTGVLSRDEIVCPASAEAGHKTTCDACRLCNGMVGRDARKSIAIVAHGSQAGKYQRGVLPFGD